MYLVLVNMMKIIEIIDSISISTSFAYTLAMHTHTHQTQQKMKQWEEANISALRNVFEHAPIRGGGMGNEKGRY